MFCEYATGEAGSRKSLPDGEGIMRDDAGLARSRDFHRDGDENIRDDMMQRSYI
jgi:hypothetical protein